MPPVAGAGQTAAGAAGIGLAALTYLAAPGVVTGAHSEAVDPEASTEAAPGPAVRGALRAWAVAVAVAVAEAVAVAVAEAVAAAVGGR